MFQHTLKNAYIGEVFEYNFVGTNVPELINIAKSWKTISRVTIEMQGSDTSTSGYGYTNIWINNWASSLAPQAVVQLDSRASWTTSNCGWFLIWQISGSEAFRQNFPSNATTNLKWACQIIITEDSCEMKVGQTFWNWIYTSTHTNWTTEKNYINSIFTSQNSVWRFNTNVNSAYTIKKLIVEY